MILWNIIQSETGRLSLWTHYHKDSAQLRIFRQQGAGIVSAPTNGQDAPTQQTITTERERRVWSDSRIRDIISINSLTGPESEHNKIVDRLANKRIKGSKARH